MGRLGPGRIVGGLYPIAYLYQPAFEHTDGYATVPTHCVITALPQSFLHARAGMAQTGALEQCRTDAKTPVVQGQEIDA